jgi:antitoxin component of MazEF toxin-antitoxin module
MIDENIEREIELIIPPHRKKEFREVLAIVPMMVQRDAFERLKQELVQRRELG